MAKLLLFPPAEQSYGQPVFPKQLKIAQQTWQSISPGEEQAVDQQEAIPGEQDESPKYHRIIVHEKYAAANASVVPLDMEVSYVVRTEGAWHTFMEVNQLTLPESADTQLDRSTANGTYRLWRQDGKIHLYSCLHKHGPTTVTPEQFQQSQYRRALTLNRLSSWLFRGTQLLEDSCLWVYLSRPAANDSLDEAAGSMEPVWETISDWWQAL